MSWLVYIIKEADFLIFHFFVEDKSNSKKRKREKLVNDMPAQTLNFTVYIHLLILTYKYHHLSELWFMSCIHDSLFVIGNNFMTLAFFLSSSLMSLNILFDFWHHYDYFVTSPFIPDLLTADLWKIKQEKIFNSDCFFFLFSAIPAIQCHHQSLHKQNQELNQLMTLR